MVLEGLLLCNEVHHGGSSVHTASAEPEHCHDQEEVEEVPQGCDIQAALDQQSMSTVRCSVHAEEGDNAYHTACTPMLGVGSLGVDACALVEGAFHALDVVHTCADDAGLHNMTPAWENKSDRKSVV